MMRDANTPLVLWICAAICAHYMFAEGGDTVARYHEDKLAIAKLGEDVRERVRFSERTFEVSTLDVASKPAEEPPPPPPPAEAQPPAPKPKPTAKADVKPPPEVKKAPAPVVKPPVKMAVQVVPEDPAKKLLEPPPQADHRIAVRQHVKPNQADNPNARFIGDEANKVDNETVATQTSHDQDDPNPTPGGNHSGPTQNPGDSDRTKIAESEEHAGEKNRGPGERGTEFEIQKDPMPTRPMGPSPSRGPPTPSPRVRAVTAAGGVRRDACPRRDGTRWPWPRLPRHPAGSRRRNWTFNPIRPGAGAGSSAEPGPGTSNKAPLQPGTTKWLGLGGHAGPGQINLNLNQTGVVAAVGMDQLRKEREADGERRKSEHRGSWTASNFERWRSAIENYVSSVKPGNQTSLNTAQVPFATYLNGMHNRIHPIFADSFLASLDSLPRDNPMNDANIFTRLEIVLTRDGHLMKMGVVRTCGITAFDIAALDSVQRALAVRPGAERHHLARRKRLPALGIPPRRGSSPVRRCTPARSCSTCRRRPPRSTPTLRPTCRPGPGRRRSKVCRR